MIRSAAENHAIIGVDKHHQPHRKPHHQHFTRPACLKRVMASASVRSELNKLSGGTQAGVNLCSGAVSQVGRARRLTLVV
jgi:hypothetical protein